MFCPKCGQQNPDEAKFCGKCGAAVTAAAPAPSPPASTFATAPVQVAAAGGAVSKTMKNVMIALSIIVPIVGIVVGIIFMLDANPEKKSAGKRWLIISVIAGVIWTALLQEG